MDAGYDPNDIGSLVYQFLGAGGAPDEARARALPGPMGINDVVSLTDRDKSLRMREDLDRETELAKIAATPLTEAQVREKAFGALPGRAEEDTSESKSLKSSSYDV